MLDEAIRRYNGKLAFALCPAPLNNQCNPYISGEVEQFKDSCELAKIALAVWAANHQKFSQFDRWLFAPYPGHTWHGRSLDAARAKAVELVGQAKFDAARADPWIDEFLQTSVRIFGNTINAVRHHVSVPVLVVGTEPGTAPPIHS